MSSFVFFKQKTAYEMRISDWSSDVCSSDLPARQGWYSHPVHPGTGRECQCRRHKRHQPGWRWHKRSSIADHWMQPAHWSAGLHTILRDRLVERQGPRGGQAGRAPRSEEHTSELQSLMRISYAVFCLKKKKQTT